jgi:hypothetical protein
VGLPTRQPVPARCLQGSSARSHAHATLSTRLRPLLYLGAGGVPAVAASAYQRSFVALATKTGAWPTTLFSRASLSGRSGGRLQTGCTGQRQVAGWMHRTMPVGQAPAVRQIEVQPDC